ncbi:MAG: hypothetical protein EOO77_44165 [Oxalobacteraceae bacterium]|nr:MAG: hypothetical protein EOO77_44165 [Oxalobacteraceae bacterium]
MILVLATTFLLAWLSVGRTGTADSQEECPLEAVQSEVMVMQPATYDRPIGTLSDGFGKVLQLFGRPSHTHRGRFMYHTRAGDDSRIPIELQFRGRRCETDQIGCEEVYTGDEMNASEFGTSAPLKVQLYRD